MRTSSVGLLIAAAIASGCGAEAAERTPQDIQAPPAQPSAGPAATDPTATVATPAGPPQEDRPLSAAERRRVTMIARSVDGAIDRFDATVLACPDASWEGCVDRAWSVLYWAMDWPPYYLRRLDARMRGCETLAVAVRGVSSFNLAARQLDYGDPADVGTAIGRRDRLSLVDALRPVPSELRTAAASGCR